ncbi:MAG: FAD-dependent oxidoreductase [Coriobacteriales bacterium]|nr:FAD-dependent oxidoreductase [Coriobacteriales bacterium]
MSESKAQEYEQNGLDRRSFLQKSLAFGAGVLGGGVLGGTTVALAAGSPESEEKPEINATHPREMLEHYTGKNAEPIPPCDPPASWDAVADVVIIGTGNAGLAASLYLAERGESVLAVEKSPMWGGVSSTAGAWVIKGGTKSHLAAGMEFNVEELMDIALRNLPYPPNGLHRKTTRKLIIKGAEAMDWFVDMGAPIKMVHPQSHVAIGPDGAVRACYGTNFAYEQALDKGADIRLETECIGLVKDGERIVGIKVKNINTGVESYFKGEKAVVVCSGGFAGNFDMLARWCPTAAKTAQTTATFPGDDGAVIRMGIGAGAEMNGWDSFCSFDGGLPDTASWYHRIREGDVQLARQPWLGIDITGNRYPYVSYFEAGWAALEVQAKVFQGLPQSCGYVFFDSDWEKNTISFKEGGCRKPETKEETPRSMVTAIDPEDWRIGIQRALERGEIKQADNFSDLAEQMGLDPQMVEKAVKDWNAMCETGEDPEYNFRPEWLIPLKKPPYFSMRIGSQVLATHCGLMVDQNFRVLDTKGKPMPGFYCASMAAGGLVGNCSNGDGRVSPFGELFLSFVTGYIAAQSILGAIDE